MVADAGSEFRGLALYDLASDRYEWVEEPTQDVDDVTISDDGRVLAWIVNDKGYDRLRLRDLDTGEDLPRTGAAGRRASAPDRRRTAVRAVAGRLSRGFDRLEPAPTARGLGRRDRDRARTSGHRQPDRRPQARTISSTSSS